MSKDMVLSPSCQCCVIWSGAYVLNQSVMLVFGNCVIILLGLNFMILLGVPRAGTDRSILDQPASFARWERIARHNAT